MFPISDPQSKDGSEILPTRPLRTWSEECLTVHICVTDPWWSLICLVTTMLLCVTWLPEHLQHWEHWSPLAFLTLSLTSAAGGTVEMKAEVKDLMWWFAYLREIQCDSERKPSAWRLEPSSEKCREGPWGNGGGGGKSMQKLWISRNWIIPVPTPTPCLERNIHK